MDIVNPDTKLQIFNVAIRLFAANGYENVSIRMIADAVGIKTASIYYHYRNKEDILEACYDFFLKHRYILRMTKEQYESILLQEDKKEILKVLVYLFPEDLYENMICALVIIFARIYSDERAKEVYIDEINSSTEYLLGFFKRGIELGRFEPFNTTAVALIILSSRLFNAQAVTIDIERQNRLLRAADNVYEDLLRLIPFTY